MQSISRTPSIYQIRHIESGKVYIGSAKNPQQRWRQHRSNLTLNKHHSPYLQFAWNKHGETAFVFEIVEPVLFIEDLLIREQYWIDHLRATDRAHGYNFLPTAGSALGAKHTDETRAKMSAIGKARAADPEHRAMLSARAKAHFANPAARAKASEITNRQFSDPAARERAAAKTREQFKDPAQLTAAAERMRARAKALWADPEWRARQITALRGWGARKIAAEKEKSP